MAIERLGLTIENPEVIMVDHPGAIIETPAMTTENPGITERPDITEKPDTTKGLQGTITGVMDAITDLEGAVL